MAVQLWWSSAALRWREAGGLLRWEEGAELGLAESIVRMAVLAVAAAAAAVVGCGGGGVGYLSVQLELLRSSVHWWRSCNAAKRP